jgi:hypothetical protein
LFVERASAANPNFNLNEGNAQAVAQICRRLDGIPLALELAAARLTLFSAERWRRVDVLRLLAAATALPASRPCALIDWAMICYPSGTQPVPAVSVFAGGCTYGAIESVCVQLDVLNLLSQLVNKSLIAVG